MECITYFSRIGSWLDVFNQCVHFPEGFWLLLGLAGLASVLFWKYSQRKGFKQFGKVVTIFLLIFLLLLLIPGFIWLISVMLFDSF
ncbi:MAG: hypothetical protein COV91_06350 [Candidatus Taylorbacteria bacterium CG11_big_fil_rev_8_21_14_0_20_46_11]|uniref:Uncharacterized protein n=1 Tax=Candidatus Taylorbacteria bacterium CG11_big_fil_rev_8_21_14_0_20_46_11 TaxID=1975025 RepID=A0A2H0KBN1_9BACT|nr:MAG: hypothetical protein COV91_06350 [Candidatus Taylorbacteria bacterium CG11_big_fil_rev_8_21_14_0_20_46_11]